MTFIEKFLFVLFAVVTAALILAVTMAIINGGVKLAEVLS